MEVLIHLLDLLATGRDYNRVYYVSVSKTLFLECNFCLIKKKKKSQTTYNFSQLTVVQEHVEARSSTVQKAESKKSCLFVGLYLEQQILVNT